MENLVMTTTNNEVATARIFKCIKSDDNIGCVEGTILTFNENPKYQFGIGENRYLDCKFARGKYATVSDCALYPEFYTELQF